LPLGDASVCSEKMAAPGEKSFCVLEYHTSKSVVTVQRAFRAKYAKDPPTDKTIRAWYKQFTETGCLCKQKSSGRPSTSGVTLNEFGPVFCVVRRNQGELQLRNYRCRKQHCEGFGVFLLQMFVIAENIMKRPVFYETSRLIISLLSSLTNYRLAA
jgi:hypothetical protein